MRKLLFVCGLFAFIASPAFAQYTGGPDDGYAMTELSATVSTVEAANDTRALFLFPNPASQEDDLWISGNFGSEQVMITFTDLLGRKTLTAAVQASNGKIKVPLAGIVPGTYMVTVETSAGRRSRNICIR
jgi:hypothetical protein